MRAEASATALPHVTRCRALVLVVDLAEDPGPTCGRSAPSSRRTTHRSRGGRASSSARRRISPDADPSVLGETRSRSRRSRGRGSTSLWIGSRLAREAAASAEERTPYVVLRPARPRFAVTREGDRYRVAGRGVERWVSETDLDDPAAVVRLQKRLVREGVERQLVSAALAGGTRS